MDFLWQRNFYGRMVRDDNELRRIQIDPPEANRFEHGMDFGYIYPVRKHARRC